MRIVFFGPPGVGKGTQSGLLVERYGLRQISTGNMIRDAMRADSPLGRKVRSYVKEGRLVPGPLVRSLAEDAIAQAGFENFILDGYPRTHEQADWLETFLHDRGVRLHAVISLDVPEENIIARLSKRRMHRETGKIYHLDYSPPPPDVAEKDLVQRQDDKPAAIQKRLQVYRDETRPVKDYYRERGIFFEVDGVGGIEEVFGRIERILKQAVPAEERR